MSARQQPRVHTIHPGAPFLPTLVDALRDGALVPGFDLSDPLAMASATIYLPTRRAARTLRALLAEAGNGASAILPRIKALGEFDEEEAAFDVAALEDDLLPPVSAIDRLLLLAPMVEQWKRQLPEAITQLYDEEVVVPVSAGDTIWLARDLARLMDDVETEGSDWNRLANLAPEDFANWWQVTLDFLTIAAERWPAELATRGLSSPSAHRNALIRAEAARLTRIGSDGPVIAAGSTGSIPATAELLSTIARLPNGAVVLPGLDQAMAERSWAALGKGGEEPAVVGHPQFGLRRLIGRLGVARADVTEIGKPEPALAARTRIVSEAMRPAETTDEWAKLRAAIPKSDVTSALAGVTLIDAANEREEALAIACAIRLALQKPGHRAAVVTADRELARRVGVELRRFGIEADDSGGTPLAIAPPAVLFRTMLAAVYEPSDPVRILSLIKHPLLRLGLIRLTTRTASETIELVAMRGGAGRPTLATLAAHFEERWQVLVKDHRNATWFDRITDARLADAHDVLQRLNAAVAPLWALAGREKLELSELAAASIAAFEALGRGEDDALSDLYAGDGGQKLAEVLRSIVSATAPYSLSPSDWPAVFDALLGAETVKPRLIDDSRVAIWGTLEARLQSVDTLILGGLNEGSWPRKVRGDRFLSRLMRNGIDLDPPEREIGLAAHDFQMALGGAKVILSRSARAGDAPAVPSRWLQRLTTFAGEKTTDEIRQRGDALLKNARDLDAASPISIPRASYAPPLEKRPKNFSVTEIETLRRDPYAVYARRILNLKPIEPLIRDPSVAERGTLFHLILHQFKKAGIPADAPDAEARLLEIGRRAFDDLLLPADVEGVWWPRFARTARDFIRFEKQRAPDIRETRTEVRAKLEGALIDGISLSGYADRIDTLTDGRADLIDYKTGSSPSKRQAHTLISPQLPLEAALLNRGAFADIGARKAGDLIYVRLKANGLVVPDSILELNRKTVEADALGERAWQRLEELLVWFGDPAHGYRSRVLPFRESDMDGDYDHLARVMEWSAGAEEEDEYGSGE